jgi:hypothetical protein
MSAKKRPGNGNLASRRTAPPPKSKHAPRDRLARLLGAAYDHFQKVDDPQMNARCRRNFIFHMTDWSEDLERLAELYQHPEKFDKASAAKLVAGFLYHVIPHLQAAGRLGLDYTPEDIFREVDYTSG